MNYTELRKLEFEIVRKLVAALLEKGWSCNHVNNGDGWIDVGGDINLILCDAFAVDDALLGFQNPTDVQKRTRETVQIVCGNGPDLISNWTASNPEFNTTVESVNDWADQTALERNT